MSKYKVGDKVIVKTVEELLVDFKYCKWHDDGTIDCHDDVFIPRMREYCGKVVTIKEASIDFFMIMIEEDSNEFNWVDGMFKSALPIIDLSQIY